MINHDLTTSGFWNDRWEKIKSCRSRTLDNRGQARALQKPLALVPQSGEIQEQGIAPGKLALEYNRIRKVVEIDGVDIDGVGIRETQGVFERCGNNGALHSSGLSPFNSGEIYCLACFNRLLENFESYKKSLRSISTSSNLAAQSSSRFPTMRYRLSGTCFTSFYRKRLTLMF